VPAFRISSSDPGIGGKAGGMSVFIAGSFSLFEVSGVASKQENNLSGRVGIYLE